MDRIKLSANFFLDEFIPGNVYLQFKDNIAILIRKINPKLILACQGLRDQFGEAAINTWWDNPNGNNYCGWRPHNYNGGAEFSDHREGNAADLTFLNATTEEVRQWIKKADNWKKLGITVIEDTVAWNHISVAWMRNQAGLWIVEPNT